MAEINLLPNEFRDKEEKERESARKRTHSEGFSLSNPADDKTTQALRAPKPSLLSRLFSKKTEPKAGVSAEHLMRHEPMTNHPASRMHLNDVAPEKVMPTPAPAPEPEPEPEPEKEKVSENKPELILKKEEIDPPAKVEKNTKKSEPRKHWSIFGRKKKAETPSTDTAGGPMQGGDLDVNLIPSELARQPEIDFKKRLTMSGAAIFITIIVIAGVYLGMTWYQVRITQEITQRENGIKQLDADIDRLEVEKDSALETQKRLTLIKGLIDNHTYWTKFFELLEENTIRDVYYTNFAMAGTDSLTIAAVAKDYRAVAEQLVAFQQATSFVKNVRIDSASAEINPETATYDGVSFSVNLDFVPGIFMKKTP